MTSEENKLPTPEGQQLPDGEAPLSPETVPGYSGMPDNDADEPDDTDDTDTAPLKPVKSEEVPEGIENETPESSWHGRDLSGIEEPRRKLRAYNWLGDITSAADCDLVKVQFKNTRSGFYRNVDRLDLKIGDMVAVEASPGHDIGEVVMIGPLVMTQLKKANLRRESDIKKIFRKARPADLEKYEEAKSRDVDTMIKARRIAADLGLNMKIGDVEYQGDGAKAIFYYIADERVDFRKLIRILADAFKVRIEMKQIGARQEAGRIGGIGPCGRPLCCSSWLTHFASVGTSMARMQDLSMNPQKLAGQCAKLKCCLNFEAATYAEAQNKLPQKDIILQTKDADFYLFKTDVLKREVIYSTDKSVPANLVTISARRAHEIIALNKQGIKPDFLSEKDSDDENRNPEFFDLTDQDSLTRFDKSKKRRRNRSKNKNQEAAPKAETAEKQPAEKPRQQQQQQERNRQRRDKQAPARNRKHKEQRDNDENKKSEKKSD